MVFKPSTFNLIPIWPVTTALLRFRFHSLTRIPSPIPIPSGCSWEHAHVVRVHSPLLHAPTLATGTISAAAAAAAASATGDRRRWRRRRLSLAAPLSFVFFGSAGRSLPSCRSV